MVEFFRERQNSVCLYIGQPATSCVYSVPRDSHSLGVVRLMNWVLWLGCAISSDRLIHTYRSLRGVYHPYRLFPSAELRVLYEVGSGSAWAMNVPNYYDRNPRSRASSEMTTQWGVLLSYSATHSTRGLFFLV